MLYEEGIHKSKTIILDAAHTKAMYSQKSVKRRIIRAAKLLRKEVYSIDESIKEVFQKKVANGILADVIEYCKKSSHTISILFFIFFMI